MIWPLYVFIATAALPIQFIHSDETTSLPRRLRASTSAHLTLEDMISTLVDSPTNNEKIEGTDQLRAMLEALEAAVIDPIMSLNPTSQPTCDHSDPPSATPSDAPTDIPSAEPTTSSEAPTIAPSCNNPDKPSDTPSYSPSDLPSDSPSNLPSGSPSNLPSDSPSDGPSELPSNVPSYVPSSIPSLSPIDAPTTGSTFAPTVSPVVTLSTEPSAVPSVAPRNVPVVAPPVVTPVTLSPVVVAAPVVVQPTIIAPTPPSICPGITDEERIAQILAILDAVANPDDIRNNDTPQGLATTWIIEQDEFQACPDYVKLVQRWTLAVMYYSTNGNDWFQCSANVDATDLCGIQSPFEGAERFLSSNSECKWAGISCIDGCVTEIEFGMYTLFAVS